MRNILILLLIALAISLPSVKLGLDPSDPASTSEFIKSMLTKGLPLVPIRDFHFDQRVKLLGPVKMDYTNIKFVDIDKDNVAVTFNVKKEEITFKLTGLKMKIAFDYDIKSYFLTEASSDALQIDNITVGGEVRVKSEKKGDKFIPFVEITSAKIDNISTQMQEKEEKTPFRRSINLLLELVDSNIKTETAKEMIGNAVAQTNKDVAEFLTTFNYKIPISEGILFDVSLAEEIVVDKSMIQLGITGLFEHERSAFEPKEVILPDIKEIEEDFASFVTVNTINSALLAAKLEGDLDLFVSPEMSFGIVTTDSLNGSVKGLVDFYGSGKKMSVDMDVKTAPEVTLDNSKINSEFEADFRFIVGNKPSDSEAFVLKGKISTILAIVLKNERIFMKIDKLSLTDLEEVRKIEQIREINAEMINNMLSLAITGSISIINSELEKYGLPVPSVGTLKVEVEDNHISVGGKYTRDEGN